MKPTTRMYEAISAMQKAIRRSMEEEAGYWFWWLAENGWAPVALNRLLVTAYEDIGLADSHAVLVADTAIRTAKEMLAAKKSAWKLPAATALLALARASKSREADHFQAAMRSLAIRMPNKEVPDWALDKHTMRGKKMGRSMDHFRQEGARLIPEAHDAYEEAAYAAWNSGILAPPPDSGNQGGAVEDDSLFAT